MRRTAFEAESADRLSMGDADEALFRVAGYRSFGQFRRSSAGCLVNIDDQVVTLIPFKRNWEHHGPEQHLHRTDPDDQELGRLVVEALRRADTPVNLDGISDI